MRYTSSYLLVVFALFISAQAQSDSFLVLRGSSEHSLSSISELYVSDLVSHVSGLPPVHQETNRNEFPKTNLFSSPAANVFIAIDAVSTELLNSAQTNFLNVESEQTVQVHKTAYPEDSLSTLTSILTGEDHESHGIVGHSWKASRDVSVGAYSKHGNCIIPKIVDRIAVSSQGSARVISASGSQKMAAAMGINTEMMQQHPEWNGEAIYFSRKRGLVDLYSDETIFDFGKISEEAGSRRMSLKTYEGYILAAELTSIASIPNRLAAMNRGDTTTAPDFIGIAVTSIKALTIQYGADSPQVLEALRLIDAELNNMFVALEEMYSGDIVTEIVGLSAGTSEHTFYTQAKQQVKLVQEDDTPTDTDTYSADDVSAFQTTFWVAIVLIIAAFISTTALVKMDMLENSLIYRSTDGPRPIPDVS